MGHGSGANARPLKTREGATRGSDRLIAYSSELIDITVEVDYLADPDVPLDHHKFLVGHEIGETELKLGGSTFLSAKQRNTPQSAWAPIWSA